MNATTCTGCLRRRRTAAMLLAASLMLGTLGTPARAAEANAGSVVTVRVQSVARTLEAYGQVEPIAIAQVRAVDAGTLNDLEVVPGSVVRAGQVLARIGGPRMRSTLTAREQALHAAQAREDAARHALQIVKRKLAAELATRQEVDGAQADLAAAQAAAQTADAQLHEVRGLRTIRAPTAGTVIAVQAANGEQIAPGETLLTLQASGKLWVRATYYGADAAQLHVGMRGRFQPAGSDESIPVRIAAISSALGSDAGLRVGLLPASSLPPEWLNGQWGSVTLEGPSRRMVSVPTSALILDRGRWWVLVHTAQGDKPREVVPGSSRGWQTSIASGLQPGEQVVVQDAFLEYHRGIARSYQPPD